MFRKILAREGESYEDIARRVYGDSQEAYRLREANPGVDQLTSGSTVVEALPGGTVVFVPPLPEDSGDRRLWPEEEEPDAIGFFIRRRRFRFWTTVSITRSVDSMDTIELSAPFEESARDFKTSFRPFSYADMSVTVGGERLFTGTMLNATPVVTSSSKTFAIQGYSTPGVLGDCTAPSSGVPLEFRDQKINEIAAKLAGFFGINVDLRGDAGTPFGPEVQLNGARKILEFLIELAVQRNLIISSSQIGDLILQRVAQSDPVTNLTQGQSPLLTVEPQFQAQHYYSHLTGIQPTVLAVGAGTATTAINPHITTLRTLTFRTPDTDNPDGTEAVNSKMGRMFGDAVKYVITVATWRDSNGNLWEPGSTISLLAPDAMIYRRYQFIIREVRFTATATLRTSTLELVLPGSLSGEIPETLPWDG
jgi:prophage tail gpP-like protein